MLEEEKWLREKNIDIKLKQGNLIISLKEKIVEFIKNEKLEMLFTQRLD